MPGRNHTHQTGRAGEYYVAAELNRRGLDAVVFSGNVPHFDAVAVTPRRKTLYIQVKTQRDRGGWQVDVRERQQRPRKDMFWVLVLLPKEEPPQYWVIPDDKMREIIQQKYDDKKHQFQTSNHCAVTRKYVKGWEGGWDRLR